MLNIFKALITIAKNLQRIREILEIAYAKELSYHKLKLQYSISKGQEKDSDREFYFKPDIDKDEYGEALEPLEEEL